MTCRWHWMHRQPTLTLPSLKSSQNLYRRHTFRVDLRHLLWRHRLSSSSFRRRAQPRAQFPLRHCRRFRDRICLGERNRARPLNPDETRCHLPLFFITAPPKMALMHSLCHPVLYPPRMTAKYTHAHPYMSSGSVTHRPSSLPSIFGTHNDILDVALNLLTCTARTLLHYTTSSQFLFVVDNWSSIIDKIS